MRKIRVLQFIELCVLIVIAVYLVIFLSYSSRNNQVKKENSGFYFGLNLGDKENGIFKKLKEEKIESSEVKKVEIDFDSGDIEILAGDEEVIRVVESASRDYRKEELFTLTNDNGILRITRGKRRVSLFIFYFGIVGHKVQVYVPKSYLGDLRASTGSGDIALFDDFNFNHLEVNEGSGDLTVKGALKLQKLDIKLASGDVNIRSADCIDYTLSTASGDITADYLKGSGKISASSGDITVRELIGGTYEVSAASGDIKLHHIEGAGKVDAASGDIDLEYRELREYAKLSAASGDIKVRLAETISFEMIAECMSGDVSGNIEMQYEGKEKRKAKAKIGNGPYAQLKITISSGDISVNQ